MLRLSDALTGQSHRAAHLSVEKLNMRTFCRTNIAEKPNSEKAMDASASSCRMSEVSVDNLGSIISR
jgi:hypothetical protein